MDAFCPRLVAMQVMARPIQILPDKAAEAIGNRFVALDAVGHRV